MSAFSNAVRTAIILRAGNRCEYCGLSQAQQEAVFHIDHIVPRASGGPNSESNLALACVSCSLHKAAKLAGVDPDSGNEVSLFNPRSQKWTEHFQWNGEIAVGITVTGRATVTALKMNRPLIIAIRQEEKMRGRHPYL